MIQARLRKAFPAHADSTGFTLDVEIEAGDGITVLFGPSGSGKTLTLDCIAGFAQPDEGRIQIEGRLAFDAVAGLNVAPRHRGCGYVFQHDALFPHMSLRKNLEFAAAKSKGLEGRRRVHTTLERFHLTEVAGRRPHQVSGGERQRCSIGRALIGEPRAMLLDEASTGLDPALREDFYSLLRQVREDFGLPTLLVTHDLEEALALGDQMIVLRDGRVLQAGRPRHIFDRPGNIEVARLLGRYNLATVEIRALDPGRNTSRLRFGESDLNGPYLPGHLIGDRVHLCTLPEQLRARPRNGRSGPNEVPAVLERAVERPVGIRLEFAGGLAVETVGRDAAQARPRSEWMVEFPPEALRVL